MKSLYRILTFVAFVGVFSQCANDGEYEHPIVYDNKPDIPVLFPGTKTAGANPYYQIQFAGDATPININISIPSDAATNIREVTKVLGGLTGITAGQTVGSSYTAPAPTGQVVAYVNAPIAVNGKSTTFTTTVGALNGFIAGTANDVTQTRVDAITTSSPATPYLEYAFMFQLTMEDGTTIVPQQVRLRFVK